MTAELTNLTTEKRRHFSTSARKVRFLKALARVNNVHKAAEAAGVTRQAAYLWRKNDLAFAEAWDSAVLVNVDLVEESLFEKAVAGDVVACIFILKNRRPETYRETIRHEIVQREAQKLADQFGMTLEEVMTEAEAMLAGR